MSSFNTSFSPLQAYHVRNLLLILQRANAHYRQVAASIRATVQPTHHARKQAQRLGLKVDIHKAVRCEQKQVSVVPLPILDISVSPVAQVAPVSSSITPSPTLETIRMQAQELKVLDGKSPLKKRPALRCIIPGAVTQTTPNGTTSTISVTSSTPHLTSISLSSPAAASTILRSKLVRSVSMWSPDDEEDALSLCPDVSMDVPVNVSVALGIQDWQPLDVPIDEAEIDWNMDISSPSSDSDNSTSGTQSSSGPATPNDDGPVVIRIKRKSYEVSGSATDEFEKRPRFERKEWVQPTTQRRNVIRIPARR